MPQQQSRYLMHHPHDDMSISENTMAVDQPATRKLAPKVPSPPPSLNYQAQADHTICGRKRSRADIGEDLEVGELEALAGPVQPPKPKAEPKMGPGMTLIYDEPELNIGPESQTGTWAEDRAAVDAASIAAALVDRPRLPARKSSRRVFVDGHWRSSSLDDIDPIVLRLGVGWKRMSDVQAASVAGDEAFIRSQYPYVQSPKLLLHHDGMGIYVVRSNPIDCYGTHQWWMFQEGLRSCQLLCNSNEEDVLRRLSNKVQDERGNWIPHILADGQIIFAKDSPQADSECSSGEVMEIDV